MSSDQTHSLSRLDFFLQFIFQPHAIASIAPSSEDLGQAMVDSGRVKEADYIVEFGPGTGAITHVIRRSVKAGAGFMAIEMNPKFVALLREQYADVTIIEDDAINTRVHLAKQGISQCDVVISGLPFAGFSDTTQSGLLRASWEILKPGGRFVTYTYVHSPYLPLGRRFRGKLEEQFGRVEKTPIVWSNLPPAFAYYATKS